MMIPVSDDILINASFLKKYFESLVNSFFKILPLKENEEDSLGVYLKSLQVELLGCKSLIDMINEDPLMLSLASILQYFIDNPSCEVSIVKREVFHAISICNKLKARYASMNGEV